MIYLLILSSIIFFKCSGLENKLPVVENLSKCPQNVNRELVPVIFVHGFKGSDLYKGEQKVWLTPSQGLGFSSPDLSLLKNDEIRADYPVSKLELLFGLIKVKIYSEWLDSLENNKNIQPYLFTYDWRKDNNITASNLEKFMDCVKNNHNGKSPYVVGHSNGGNLTLSVMNKKPDLFTGAIIVGAPIRGGIGFMEDLIPGLPTGFNSKIASPCVSASFETPYTFFPRNYSFDSKGLIIDENGKPLEMDFFKAEDWKKYGLGNYHFNSKCKELFKENEFQQRLDNARKFKDSFEPKKKQKYPKVLVVYGESIPTLESISGKNTKEGWIWNFKDQKKVPGDGRVVKEHAQLPPGIEHKTFVSEFEHSQLLNDPKVQNVIFKFIEEEG